MASHPFEHARDFIQRFNLERLTATLEKADAAYEALAPETIDYGKCLIECICKHILDEKGEDITAGIPFPALIKQALAASGMQNNQILGNLSGLVGGLAEIRNTTGVAGHGVHGTVPLPTPSDIRIFASMVSGLLGVLWHLHAGDGIDVIRTSMSFESVERKLDLQPVNELIDADVKFETVPDDGLIFIDGKEVRPSALLFAFDRKAYFEKMQKFQLNPDDDDDDGADDAGPNSQLEAMVSG